MKNTDFKTALILTLFAMSACATLCIMTYLLNKNHAHLYIKEVKKNNQLMIDNVKLKQINNTYDSLLRVCMGMKGLKQKQNGSK